MFTQIRERDTAGQLVELDAPGPTVQLFEQTQDHQCKFGTDPEAPETLAAGEFFSRFREATPEEIEAPPPATRGRGRHASAED